MVKFIRVVAFLPSNKSCQGLLYYKITRYFAFLFPFLLNHGTSWKKYMDTKARI